MWRRAAAAATAAGEALGRSSRHLSCSSSTSSSPAAVSAALLRSLNEQYLKVFKPPASASPAANPMLLRTLSEQFLEISKSGPCPVTRPPAPFVHMIHSMLMDDYPMIVRSYNGEDINIFANRESSIAWGAVDLGEDDADRVLLRVRVTKQEDHLQFLCVLYPDSMRVLSVVPPSTYVVSHSRCTGPPLEKLDGKLRDALRGYLEERGINESLYPFLHWRLHARDLLKLVWWFRSIGTFISPEKPFKVDALKTFG